MMADLLAGSLAALATSAALLALFFPLLQVEKAAERRKRAVLGLAPAAMFSGQAAEEKARRDLVAYRLKQAARQEADRRKEPPLQVTLVQAGLTWSARQYVIGSVALGVMAALFVALGTKAWFFAPLAGVAVGYYVPRQYVKRARKQRIQKFVAELPNALDMVVRAAKAGLHINEAFKMVVKEARDPVRAEFQTVVEAQNLGSTLAEAIDRLAVRMPVDETRFLAVAIALQAAEGGAIAESLKNLADTLRDRKKMKDKISGMSAEARAGGLILSALPYVAIGISYASTPKKTMLLFTTTAGQLTFGISTLLIALGFFVLKKMQDINT